MSRNTVASALFDVQARIRAAAKSCGRDPTSITLIGVSKTHDAATATLAIEAGQRDFGENRVQEAEGKWPDLKAAHAVQLHLIGPLQTNKAHDAVALFDVIHTLDRPRLAEKLADEMRAQARSLPCFVQVNTGREAQKAGIDPAEAEAFITACRNQWNLPVVGLMCIPPVDEEAALHFAFLREIAKRNNLTQLSMGMSDDFEIAITLGATHIRVGSAIFGSRAFPGEVAAGSPSEMRPNQEPKLT
jgi:pyridoxal phosphate enzyme (YggS family)